MHCPSSLRVRRKSRKRFGKMRGQGGQPDIGDVRQARKRKSRRGNPLLSRMSRPRRQARRLLPRLAVGKLRTMQSTMPNSNPRRRLEHGQRKEVCDDGGLHGFQRVCCCMHIIQALAGIRLGLRAFRREARPSMAQKERLALFRRPGKNRGCRRLVGRGHVCAARGDNRDFLELRFL